jgi:iron complex outermembrane receptor protein
VLPDWTVGAGGRYVGKRYSNNANTIALPAYTTVDLSVRWKATPDTTLSLRGFNVLDRLYYSSYYYSASQWLVGEGRRVELSVHHRF